MYADAICVSCEAASYSEPTLAPSLPAGPGEPRDPVGPTGPGEPRSPGRPLSP